MIADGFPIWRASITMPSIHPMYRGVSANFIRGGATVLENAAHGSVEERNFEKTPIFYLLSRGERTGRWILAKGEGFDYPQLKEFALAGGTDHVVSLFEFPKEVALRGLGFSLTSDAPGGFSDDQLATVKALVPALGLAAYRVAASKTATDILAVYTGARTSARILAGETQRGTGGSINAAILLADLRNFTALTEVYQPGEIVGFLNEHFELIDRHVEENSGEILKFMGDSVLAIFPTDADDPQKACMAALASAKNLLKANEALNRERTQNGGPDIGVDVVLHLGEVFYGNVGARGRLDFTVIGRAVNEASRLEKLCGTLEQDLLMSESFATTCAVACEYLGSFELRGVSKRAEVFKLAGPGS
ncbi:MULTISPECIES: adenylate/guanylate cyclase domain-containing protein [Rhizobium]|uniref:Adenylate/guanylate cyclase domain-containing protein n=1 Tax=Rhizobium laguerreae TaxID=1076926 RepID=A0A7Y2R4T0_9HYPH|nr:MULTISPECIES: adenylate/guanylate cyclase domain-containing protein [Rhizobium]MBY5406182.1 adenylate/guanylate cyclase domain-containing protein [Rhizobium leguminosarum]NDK50923.1 adenylate/guanylate cyclase domain-containing protein [Rhizobium laguerreae]NNH64364.1 adenylate/guanylate cyclase domain-containing protein [Rhizobium laguerreae]UWM77942.1 adenylate/guanylate cyclase domain-containing protein [Rhizobium leguminosarum bv. viciae]